MNHLIPWLTGLALSLAACAGPAADPTPTATPEPTPSPTPGGTATPAATPASPTPSPTDEPPTLPAFDCDAVPLEDEGTVSLANIADVRVGEHEDFDRIVFEFQPYGSDGAGIPEHLLRHAEPPLTDDPRGAEMDVAGDAFLQLTLLGGTRLTAEFEETYTGPLRFEVDFPQLRELVEAGDFEATANWYIGMESEDPCLRVMVLDDPSRLVIDIEHP